VEAPRGKVWEGRPLAWKVDHCLPSSTPPYLSFSCPRGEASLLTLRASFSPSFRLAGLQPASLMASEVSSIGHREKFHRPIRNPAVPVASLLTLASTALPPPHLFPLQQALQLEHGHDEVAAALPLKVRRATEPNPTGIPPAHIGRAPLSLSTAHFHHRLSRPSSLAAQLQLAPDASRISRLEEENAKLTRECARLREKCGRLQLEVASLRRSGASAAAADAQGIPTFEELVVGVHSGEPRMRGRREARRTHTGKGRAPRVALARARG
jgi:hypothetical protein